MGKLSILILAGLVFWANPTFGQSNGVVENAPKNQQRHFVPNIIIVKIQGHQPDQSDARIGGSHSNVLPDLLKNVNATRFRQLFPKHNSNNARAAKPAVDLSTIYEVHLPSGTSLWQTIKKLQDSGEVVYAEPLAVNLPLEIPSDPMASPVSGQQEHLGQIKAYDAWDEETGDTTIVIGLVDTGVNYNHPDLKDNIALNYADPVNGVDDDHDGYVDNFRGWDMADDDNDPITGKNGHGSSVAGMSSARTNNGLGVAGTGFKTKFLEVKAFSNDTKTMVNEYQGVVYAADHGCKVINLSWGGIDAYSKFGQDVINYAVLDRDAVVVAAAGNTHANLDFYPASFDNVLSVGATDSHDNLASWATYSYHIDLMAPGNYVYTVDNNGGYSRKLGTSFSAPQVAGAAALVRAHFPNWTAQQVMEQLRVTADDIYGTGSNGNFQGMLGRGRLNMARALTETSSPAVRMAGFNYESSFGQLVFPGDTVKINASFVNYLSNASNIQVTLSSPDENMSIIQGAFYLGDMASLEKDTTGDKPFIFQVPEDAAPGQKMVFRLDFDGGGYHDFQYFNIFVTPESFDFTVGSLSLTIGSDGSLGYNNIDFPNGQGLHFDGKTVASQLGLILAKDSVHVSDNVINNFATNTGDHDFQTIEYARLYKNTEADEEARSSFRESDDLPNKLGIKVEQKTLGWETAGNHPFIIVEYRLTNLTDSMMTHLDAGVFADWDLNNFQHNAVEWDAENKMGYAFDKETNGLFAGMAILTSDGSPAFHGIDKGGFGGNTSEIQDTLNNARKFGFLSSGLTKTTAGQNGTGNDVAQLIGVNGLSLNPKQSKKTAFVFLLGKSKEELLQSLQEARDKYQEYVDNPPIDTVLSVCKGQSATIPQGDGETLEFYKDAQLVHRLDSGANYNTPPIEEDQTYYTVKVENGFRSDAGRVLVRPNAPGTGFTYHLDTLDISRKYVLKFSNTTQHVTNLQWLVDGQNIGDAETFEYDFQNKSEFTVTQVMDSAGCSDSLKMLIKPALSPNPSAGNIVFCPGDSARVQPENGSIFYFYEDEQLQHLVHKGHAFNLDGLTGKKTVYVTGMDSLLESEPVAINLRPTGLKADFTFSEDTVNLATTTVLQITNTSQDADWFYWILPSQAVDSSQVLDRDLRQEPGYQYELVAGDQYGCTDTVSKSVAVMDVTALDKKHISPTTLYPNPATDRISFKGNGLLTANQSYQILDSSGKVVGQGVGGGQPGFEFTVKISSLAKGIYFIKIYNQDHLYFGKFIKQ